MESKHHIASFIERIEGIFPIVIPLYHNTIDFIRNFIATHKVNYRKSDKTEVGSRNKKKNSSYHIIRPHHMKLHCTDITSYRTKDQEY